MEEYKQWLNKAEDDLLWTKNSLNGKIWYGACFSAQQAAEKALKGYLISYEKPLRKIHDLRALLEDCILIDKDFKSIRKDSISLNSYYVVTRYPAYEEIDKYTQEQAHEAYEHAVKVVEFVKSKLQ